MHLILLDLTIKYRELLAVLGYLLHELLQVHAAFRFPGQQKELFRGGTAGGELLDLRIRRAMLPFS